MWFRSLLLALLLGGVASAAPPQWQTFQNTEGRFSVSAFGKPETQVKSQSSPLGSINEHTFIWLHGDLECDLAYSDIPSLGTLAGGKILFNELARGFAKRDGEPVQNLRDWSLQNSPGRAFEFHQPKRAGKIEQVGTVRAVLVGNRFYVLIATWNRNALPAQQSDADQFFSSFHPTSP